MTSVLDDWNRLERWLGENFPEALADLNPGCNESALQTTEEKLGVTLPDSLKEVYRLHDGQKTTDLPAPGIFYGVCFLPLTKMIYQWNGWSETNEHIDKEGWRNRLDEFQTSFEPGKVRAIYSNNKWIPFALLAENCYLGLDFDPAPGGVEGQVINFGREEEQKTVLADSFGEFLNGYVSELERGNFLVARTDRRVEFLPKELAHRVLERRSPYLGVVATRFIDDGGFSILRDIEEI